MDICEHLKNLPLNSHYDQNIWNEYFMERVQMFQNKMRFLKNQFEQLEEYFKSHNHENSFESQSNPVYELWCKVCSILLGDFYLEIVETMRIIHKNFLNEAANLKTAHENVEVTEIVFV